VADAIFCAGAPSGVDVSGWLIPVLVMVGITAYVGATHLLRFLRARRELDLVEREHSYHEIFNATTEAIFVFDAATGATLDVNRSVTDLFGYTREEALHLSVADLSTSTTGSGQLIGPRSFAEAAARGSAVIVGPARHKRGNELWVEVTLRSASLAGRHCVLAVVRDISDRTRAEFALREVERFNEMVVDAIPGVVYIWDLGTQRAVYTNKNVADLLGYSPEEEAAMGEIQLAQVVHPDDMQAVAELLSRWDTVTDDEVLTSEYRVRARDGELRWLIGRDKVFSRGPDNRVQQIIGSVHDITERRRAELALKESEARYRALVEASPSGILLIDHQGLVTFANPVADRICGLSETASLTGRAFHELVVPEDRSILEARIRAVLHGDGSAGRLRLRLLQPGGEVRHLDFVAVRLLHDGEASVLGVGHDVTEQVLATEERSRLEQQLRDSQKMEAVGRLAGGVAHDFNNLLQAILGNAELLSTRVSDPDAVAAGLAELADNARRGARLTRQLLVFSRREATHMESLDLRAVIADATTLVRRLLRETIRLEVSLADEPLLVHADRGQIEQVVMNLAVNAADAMPSGGVLTVRTGGGPDAEVWFEVADTGHGIADDLRQHIFDPFFTTKTASEGTGLGLSVVHAIVAQHQGQIELDTRVGEGARFRIRLPRRRAPGADSADGRGMLTPALVRGEGRRILVVEDEAGARVVLGEILTMLGFEVVTAATVASARTCAAGQRFAVLLSDVVLPDGVGNDLATELQTEWPDLVVILMSGYAQDAVVRTAVVRGEVHFLQKPFGMTELAQELARALRESSQVGRATSITPAADWEQGPRPGNDA